MAQFPVPKGSDRRVRRALQKVSVKYGPNSIPPFGSVQLNNLTASALTATDSSKVLESVTIGTGLSYATSTLSLSHLGLEDLTGPGADRIFFWDESESASKFLSVGNSIAITATTLDTIQDIRTSASPTFAGLNLTGNADFGGNDITDLGNVTFKTGASGGTLRTGTSAADKFVLQAYDTNAGSYTTMLELDAGVTPLMSLDHVTNITIDTTGALRTHTDASDTMLVQAYDTDGASYTTFITLTSGTTPTCDLSTDVTIGGSSIASSGGSPTFTDVTITSPSNIYNLDHDSFSGFVANEHIDHTSVTLTAGNGLSGGGDISSNRSFSLDLNELGTETTIASGDFIAMVDITDSGSQKITFSNLEGTIDHANITNTHNLTTDIDHDALTNFVANEHIDWTSTSNNLSTTGTAATGVLTVTDSIFIAEKAAADADVIGQGQLWVKSDTPNNIYFTDDAGNDRQMAYAGGSFHDGFSDFVANEHVDHTSITLTAGTGLTGGGDISANRSFSVTGVLEDLDTLGAAASDGQFIVATGAGAFAYESGSTVRDSLGLGTGDSPTLTGLTLSGLTASRLVATDGSKALSSVSNLASWIAGTSNEITVTDDLDGTVTLSFPDQVKFQNSVDSTTAFQILDADGGNPVLNVDTTNERVGIGTGSPDDLLHIVENNGEGDITTDGHSVLLLQRNDASNFSCGMTILSGTAALGRIMFADINNHEVGEILYDHSSDKMAFITNDTQVVTIDSSGNIGIGTAEPNQKLTVEDSMSLKEIAAANADTAAYGQIWVKSDTPNTLYFTNDAGTDAQVVTAGGAFHDGFSDFVANEHIDHTSVTLTAGTGLSGGGDISASRSFAVDLNELTTETSIAAGDFLAMVDITDSGSGKITFANLEATISHANISGTHNLTTDIDHDQLTNTHNLTSDIDHDALTNFVSNEHIDWTAGTANSVVVGDGQSIGATTNKWLFDDTGGDISTTAKVGIGTVSPSSELEVNGTLGFTGTGTINAASGDVRIGVGGTYPVLINANRLALLDDKELALGNGSDYSLGYNSGDDTFRIVDGASIGANARLVIDSNGNVGIGTTGPNESLTVEDGVISIKETTTPTATTNYGKVYTKTDNKLYFQDGAGTEHEIAFV